MRFIKITCYDSDPSEGREMFIDPMKICAVALDPDETEGFGAQLYKLAIDSEGMDGPLVSETDAMRVMDAHDDPDPCLLSDDDLQRELEGAERRHTRLLSESSRRMR